MKKIFAALLAVTMIVTFVGCKDEKKEPAKTAVTDLEYYADLGQIPETKYTLGQDVDAMVSAFEGMLEQTHDGEEEVHNHDDFFYNVVEYDEYTSINTGGFEYCYRPENKDKGISCIISYGDAYGFSLGTISIEIKNGLTKFELTETEESDVFFLPAGAGYTCYTYSFEKNNITFVIVDNALCATILYDNSEWEL